ncbi:MAG TPA: prolipoprotein diacylglyceryl transferase [Ruminococcaceae bacterium]|jgi:phosphatidylglycerol:prolipoprotein diacylglycerol transferase|nr:prolipoprotein diacylglyceryl transferase [Oscillospiraceae bacterium]HCC02775.1 prolipoprotein diacylglyceryl transferase [Oscillospiraceae bacterium]HCM23124.1 prolipoprotein diacylglyceryl transferase [Oscillospiraceae bacterium]
MYYHIRFPGLGISLQVNRIAFSIGSFHVYWYGILIAVGFILAVIYAMKSAPKFGLNADKLMNCIIVGILCGIVGARAYFVIFYPGDMYFKDPSKIFRIHDGGLAIYGGVIGGLLGGCITAKINKQKVTSVLDIAALGFLIGQSIGRWGNFVNQEAFGIQTNLPWGMVSENTGNVPVHPCFFYESMWCLLGFVLLHFFSRKLRHYDGQVFLLYLLWYGVERFFVEGLRTDSLLLPRIPLRVSQVLSGILVIVSVILLFAFRNRTVLSGSGSPHIVALNSIVDDVPKDMVEEQPEEKEPSSANDMEKPNKTDEKQDEDSAAHQ